MKIKIFLKIIKFPLIVLIIHFLSWPVYDYWPRFDILMHFLGGFSIAFMSVDLYKYFLKKHKTMRTPRTILFFGLFSFITLIAVLWEFHEYLLDYFFQLKTQLSLADTIGDIFMGMLGGYIGLSLIFINQIIKTKKKGIFFRKKDIMKL